MHQLKKTIISIYRKYEIFIICGIIIGVWLALILAAGRIDRAYHEGETQGLPAYLVKLMVEWGRNKKITYERLYNTIGGNTGVLFTVLGMIITGWLNISNRMEQKVYGFRRKELFWGAKVTTNLYIGVFWTPVGMMYALIHQYCFMAYFIMGMVFVQFIISNVMLAATYSDRLQYNSLIRKIRKSLKNIRNLKGFSRYDAILDRIAGSIGKETNWKELYQIFFDTLQSLDETDESLKIYKTIYSFVSKVFVSGRVCLLELVEEYTREMSENDQVDDRMKRIYWVLLDCMYQKCSEKQINDYLDWLYDEMVLDRNLDKKQDYFKIADMEDIFSMIVLQTECWLQQNNTKIRKFGGKLNRIFMLGSRQYIGSGQCLLQNLINERDNVMKSYSSMYHQCYERLVESYTGRRGQRHMGSLIESVAFIYDYI